MALAFARSYRPIKQSSRPAIRPTKLSRSALRVTSMDIRGHVRMAREAFETGSQVYPPSPHAGMLLERLRSGQWPIHTGPGLAWDDVDEDSREEEAELRAELAELDAEVARLKSLMAAKGVPGYKTQPTVRAVDSSATGNRTQVPDKAWQPKPINHLTAEDVSNDLSLLGGQPVIIDSRLLIMMLVERQLFRKEEPGKLRDLLLTLIRDRFPVVFVSLSILQVGLDFDECIRRLPEGGMMAGSGTWLTSRNDMIREVQLALPERSVDLDSRTAGMSAGLKLPGQTGSSMWGKAIVQAALTGPFILATMDRDLWTVEGVRTLGN